MKTTSLTTLNDFIAVKPIKPPQANENLNPKTRLAISTKMTGELVPTEVVFDGPDVKANDVVYFTNEIYNYPGIRKIMSVEEKEFVLIPKVMIVLKTKG